MGNRWVLGLYYRQVAASSGWIMGCWRLYFRLGLCCNREVDALAYSGFTVVPGKYFG